MSLACFIVDAFVGPRTVGAKTVDPKTPGPQLRGNPAAVVVLDAERPEFWLQATAAEFNLSETAFLQHLHDNHWKLRWFTPAVEVPLCGHGTLAAALALWEGQGLSATQWHFHTASGELIVQRTGDTLELDFPVRAVTPRPDRDADAAKLHPQFRFAAESASNFVVEFPDAASVVNYIPDFSLLRALSPTGVIITAQGSYGGIASDCVSRYFAPNKGINEDPVTGAAHCTLANYWANKLGKDRLLAIQASARGGLLKLHFRGDRVTLGGRGKLVMKGELYI